MAPPRGILLIVLAVGLFTVMGALVKAAVRIPVGEAVFFRAFFAMPVIAAWLWARGEFPSGLRTSNWRSHAVRGLAGTGAVGLGFLGLKLLPLPEVTAIRFATPILVVVFAALLLGERIRLIRMTAVAVGLCGVLIVMWPRLGGGAGGGNLALVGALVTLASAALAALAHVFVKAMTGTERTAAIVFYFSMTASALSLLTLPLGWVMPVGLEWVLLVGAGIAGALGQILMTSSYRYADAGTLAPFTYASMLWALLIGYFVFGEVPTWQMLGGATLVIAAGIAIALRERQIGREAATDGRLRTMLKG